MEVPRPTERELIDPPPFRETSLGTPAWRIALFYPVQGAWSEGEYLNLLGGPLVEFDNGRIEVLDMPTKEHQRLAQFIFLVIRDYLLGKGIGEVFMAPLPTRLWEGKFRQPNVLFLRKGRPEYKENYPEGADMVVEVVSGDRESRRCDLEEKRADYAKAGIPEYWIMDPESEVVSLLSLRDGIYESRGEFTRGQSVPSFGLPELVVSVDAWLNSAKGM